ncbi:MAG: Fur family transcriptional regulator [Phycisphaerales bacterium]
MRCTRQREALYEALSACNAHPTAEELFNLVQPSAAADQGEALSLATVYNTLDAFVSGGLARRLPCPNGPARYDADMNDHVHLNLGDGRLVDLPHDLSDRLLGQVQAPILHEIERRLGVRVTGVSVQVAADRPPTG